MLYWTAAILLFVLLFMFIYPAISQDVAVLESILSNFPVELRRALGITTLDLSNILGFYGFIYEYLLLVGAVYAMVAGMTVLSEEVRSKTADFLISKPVSRTCIYNAKALSVLVQLVLQNLVLLSISYLIVQGFAETPVNTATFALINGSLIQVQLFFAAAGLLLAVLLRRIKTVLPVALGVVFVFFVLRMIQQSINDPKLAYLTPFAYFDVAAIIRTASYDIALLMLNMVLVMVMTTVGYVLFRRQDMPSI